MCAERGAEASEPTNPNRLQPVCVCVCVCVRASVWCVRVCASLTCVELGEQVLQDGRALQRKLAAAAALLFKHRLQVEEVAPQRRNSVLLR